MIESKELKRRMSEFTELSREQGIKVTPQRLAVYRIVLASESHPGPEEVYRKIRREFPSISLDTVYRTLWLLTELGLVNTVGPRRESVRFDANLGRHHHFECVRCGAIRDFVNRELDALQTPPEASAFGRPESMRVEVRGVCADCLAKEQALNQQQQDR